MKRKLVFNIQPLKLRRKSLRETSTQAEKMLWERLNSVEGYVVDFYCPEAKLAIELEGFVHTTDEARRYDLGRMRYFESLGVKTLVFWNSEIERNLKRAITRISKYLSPGPSPVTGEGNGRGEV
ncbi:MAG: hypothetical protein UY33_C0029G0017 [Candidatus Amesbacteria bacterium GW2011_GWA1_48_9]|uniref:DUF559 domain-containing protein n=1 Tax=Candidatus Amesbacteria bacterium GW2011_GWA1_48_9 TaxID=1618355 RepID=A0A0G1UZ54_9BACT|nr:MAG: hypothetical protein UY33_C0029G0017 [Candidatus Amesbacteria bacterium GW2011_GWA1_48_9]